MKRRILLSMAAVLAIVPLQLSFATDNGLQGFSQERLDRTAPVMRAEIEKGTMPGAVTLIARNGEIVHFEAHGFIDAAKAKPMTKDAVFRAFSMTKPFVSAAAMKLVEEGKMSLRDPISNWMPEFKQMTVYTEQTDDRGRTTRVAVPAKRQITVQDLLRHTSGFTYAGSAPFPELKEAYDKAEIESRNSDLSPEELIKRLSTIPLAYEPGTRWEYGVSTDVLGVLVERVSGKRLDHYLDEILFKPLNMKDTRFQATPEQLPKLADALGSDPQKADAWKWVRVEEDPGKRYRLGGAGTVTTAEDYFRFAQMMLNGGELDGVRILSPETVEFMTSDHIAGLQGAPTPTTGPGYGFGLGFGVRLQEGLSWVPGSTGDYMWAGAGGTSFTIDPKENIVGVFMAAAPSPRLHTRFLFKNLLYGALVD
ncbi:serine hydrolase domain-containing protein [Microvirga sp. GCM10011540]|uniref:serine hydrolase domain-containing protein n=1 Tax=Microvirga sp. GCM10011540 TaxID=3317338 RepID=UPI0036180415